MSFSFGPPAPCGCRPLRRRVCAANSFGLPGRSPGNAATSASLYVWYLPSLPKANSFGLPGAVPAMLRSPTHAPSLLLAGVPALHFRNYRSHCAQNKAPLGASPVGAGLILPPYREGPHSQTTPLWRGFLHSTSGTNIRRTRRTDLYFRNYRSHYTQTKATLSASPVGVGYFPLADREGPYSPFTPLWRRFLHPASGTNIRTTRKPRPRRCLCTGAGTHRLQKRNALPLERTLSQTGFIDLLSAAV